MQLFLLIYVVYLLIYTFIHYNNFPVMQLYLQNKEPIYIGSLIHNQQGKMLSLLCPLFYI